VNKADDNFLMKAMDIIERNMENPSFDVDLFTREIGISRTLLYRKVRALTNQSINDFIRSVRLKRAAQLLQSGTYNVTEAALQSGFTNQSYFSKCFEQQFGELPSKYANKYK
jgi:AraC-like DNA-binding protein